MIKLYDSLLLVQNNLPYIPSDMFIYYTCIITSSFYTVVLESLNALVKMIRINGSPEFHIAIYCVAKNNHKVWVYSYQYCCM